jgi:hypothetical protein
MATNTLFALFNVTKPAEIQQRLDTLSPGLSLSIGDKEWLIITPSIFTTKEIADKIGITRGEVSGGILVRVENYWGHANKSIWEWIAAKLEVPFGSTSE